MLDGLPLALLGEVTIRKIPKLLNLLIAIETSGCLKLQLDCISIDFDGPFRCKQIKVLAVFDSTPSETNKSTISFELAYMSELSVEPTVPFSTAMTPIRLSEYMN